MPTLWIISLVLEDHGLRVPLLGPIKKCGDLDWLAAFNKLSSFE